MPDRLTMTLSALADPTRRAILARLSQGEAMVSELARPFAISPPAVSRHLRVLEHAGLITRTKAAQWRRCALRPEPLLEVAAWIEPYRQFWSGQLDALEAFLARPKRRKSEPGDE